MRLYGIEVSEHDCRLLIDLLLRVRHDVEHSAAAAIDRGISVQAKLIALSPAERDAILGALGHNPPPGLTELRAVLVHDYGRRHRKK
jgi:hypothetical protein